MIHQVWIQGENETELLRHISLEYFRAGIVSLCEDHSCLSFCVGVLHWLASMENSKTGCFQFQVICYNLRKNYHLNNGVSLNVVNIYKFMIFAPINSHFCHFGFTVQLKLKCNWCTHQNLINCWYTFLSCRSACVDLWRRQPYQGLLHLVDTNSWRGLTKYDGLLTRNIYSTVF